MFIGKVSKKTGFSRDTIRFYEKKGLIKLNPHDRYPNNYKKYNTAIVKRLLMIRELKEYGFTLNEIKSILAQDVGVAADGLAAVPATDDLINVHNTLRVMAHVLFDF